MKRILLIALMLLSFSAFSQSTHDYVDLGLPSGTLWATCNVGANNPWEYGDYFAWGETRPKTIYSWETYKHTKIDGTTLTKYCTDPTFGYNGFTDNIKQLQRSDDAATANWGSPWHIPTIQQIRELKENCIWRVATKNGISGYEVKSKRNGKSIFLPAAGCPEGGRRTETNEAGYYWSSTLDYGASLNACALDLDLEENEVDVDSWGYRREGMSIRPVQR